MRARGTGHGARGTGHGARGTGHGARGTGHGARGTGHVARGTLKEVVQLYYYKKVDKTLVRNHLNVYVVLSRKSSFSIFHNLTVWKCC